MSESTDTRRKSRFLLASFSLGHMANDWAPGAVWLVAPAVALDLGLSPAELGALFTIQAIGASLAYFPAGILADHVRRRGRLLAMTFWWVAIGHLLASYAPGFWTFAVVLALAGLGDAAWHPIATGVLAKRWPDRRGEALGVHAIGGALATVLSPLAVGYLLTLMDWRDALRISCIPALIMGIVFVMWVSRRVPVSTEARMTRGDVRSFFAGWWQAAGAGLLSLVICYDMTVTALMSMTPLFLQTWHGYSTAQAGTLFAAGLLAGALAQPVVGRVSDRVGRKPVLIGVLLLGAMLAASIALASSQTALVVSVVGAFGVLVGARAVILALAVDFASRREGTTLGFVFALMGGVGGLGALLAGFVGQGDLRYAFVLAGVLALTSVALALLTPLARPGAVPELETP